jgi:hypothetical protein
MKDIISIMNEDQTKHQTEKDGISRFIYAAATPIQIYPGISVEMRTTSYMSHQYKNLTQT